MKNSLYIICWVTLVLNTYGVKMVINKLKQVKSADINNTYSLISIWMLW